MMRWNRPILSTVLIMIVVVGLSPSAIASCMEKEPSWIDLGKGPAVSQPSALDPTKVVVNWKGMVRHPECADFVRVLVWRKDIDSMLAQVLSGSE